MSDTQSRFLQLSEEHRAVITGYIDQIWSRVAGVITRERLEELLGVYVYTWEYTKESWTIHQEPFNGLAPGQVVRFKMLSLEAKGILMAIATKDETFLQRALIYRPETDSHHSADVEKVHPLG